MTCLLYQQGIITAIQIPDSICGASVFLQTRLTAESLPSAIPFPLPGGFGAFTRLKRGLRAQKKRCLIVNLSGCPEATLLLFIPNRDSF